MRGGDCFAKDARRVRGKRRGLDFVGDQAASATRLIRDKINQNPHLSGLSEGATHFRCEDGYGATGICAVFGACLACAKCVAGQVLKAASARTVRRSWQKLSPKEETADANPGEAQSPSPDATCPLLALPGLLHGAAE